MIHINSFIADLYISHIRFMLYGVNPAYYGIDSILLYHRKYRYSPTATPSRFLEGHTVERMLWIFDHVCQHPDEYKEMRR